MRFISFITIKQEIGGKALPAYLLIVVLFFCSHCTEIRQQKTQSNSKSLKKELFDLRAFSEFPPEIDGCSCYYALDKTNFYLKQYIYADDLVGNYACIRLGGVMTRLSPVQSDTLPGKRSRDVWENGQYKVILELKQTGQIDETWQKEGTMTIKHKNGKQVVKKIYGECGC